jgi:K+-transporting ATPase ATPase C chain
VIDTGRKDADGNAITRPDPRYFQPRPSATGYSGTATFFANRGPNSAVARFFYRDQVKAYLDLERPYDRSLRAGTIPIDAVTASASGVDPGITRTNAGVQARRVAAQRKLPLARVLTLVRDATDGRFLGILGERQVDVVALNAALDKEAS